MLGAAAEKDSDITERKKAESQREAALEALVKSENRFRSIFESSRDAIMTLEPPYWKFTSGNPAALKMFMAKDEADFASHEPWTMSPERQPDGRASIEKAKEMIEIAMRDGSNFFEWTHKRLNGEEFPATVLLTRMILAEKTILQATVRDITERKRAESQREVALEALQKSHLELDFRVQERTAELAKANEMLQADISERKQIEETLKNSEENFRLSLEDSPLGVRIAAAKGETIYANKVFLDIYGYANVEELNKIPIKERYTPQSYAEFQMRKKDRERGDFGPSEYEINIVRKNGEIRHLQVLRNEVLWNGIKKFQVIYQDITERKRAESQREAALEALRESEEKYRTLFTSSSDAIMLIEPISGKFISGNQTTMAMFGLKNDDDFSSFGPWDFSPERQPDECASAEKAKEMNEIAMRDGSNFFEWSHKRLNGEEFSTNVRLTRMVLDKKTILQATVRDITEQKKAELALQESEERYRALFDRSLDLVYIHDFDGRFIDANEAALNLFGYNKEEIRGLDFSSLLSDDQLPFTRKTMQEIRETGFQKDLTECRLRLRNGNEVYMETKGSAIISKGTYTGIQVLARNITERKQAEGKIKNSLVEKEVLLKEVHHRVKNNLMIIIGLIKMQGTKANIEMFNPLLLELEGRVRAMALVHESLHKSEDLVHVNLQNYIETMSGHIRAQFGLEHDIRFSVQAAGVDVGLDIAVPCGLILNELVTNACKYAFPGDKPRAGEVNCEIAVTAKHEGGMLTLTVADNGIGLPAEVNWENPETLGLRLIKMLSQQINGSLEMERSSGTVFRLKFPMAVP